MPVPKPAPQSAAERRAAESQVRALVARMSPDHARLVAATRRALRKRLPAALEVVYEYRDWFVISFSPSDRGYEGVLAIRGSADDVRLCFNRGKELSDPDDLLRGSGSLVRWIELKSAAALARPNVARLLDEAIRRNRVPFARSGAGAVQIRTASAKKARPRRPA